MTGIAAACHKLSGQLFLLSNFTYTERERAPPTGASAVNNVWRRVVGASYALVAACLCLLGRAGSAQTSASATQPDSTQGGTILGELRDAASALGIPRVTVSVRGLALQSITDTRGRFIIRRVPVGVHTVDARGIGYTPVTRENVTVRDRDTVQLTLISSRVAVRLAEVMVAPGSYSFFDTKSTSQQTLSRQQIETAPFGEDLFRAMSRLPGLSSSDYGAQFSIRGGRQDETLILLDGLELYEPFHLKDFNEGALSIIDVDAIDGVDLLTGGFPVLYGDKRSGVMNVRARTPRADGTHLTSGASLTNAHVLAEGTFAGGKGSWLASGRRGFFDVLLRLINKKETKTPSYYDVFGTLRYALGSHHTFALNALNAGDRYKFFIRGTTGFNDSIPTTETADNRYGNGYVWFNSRSQWGEHLVASTVASIGEVTASRQGDERTVVGPVELYGVKGSRNFTVRGLRQDYRVQYDRNVLEWGVDARWLRASFDWENRVTQNPDNPVVDTTGFYPRITRRTKRTAGTTVGAWINERFRPVAPLTLELGLRYDGASYTHDRNWSPRIHAMLQLSERNVVRAGWGHYRQRQGIADENAFDALNRYFPSELSKQWTLGFEHRYADNGQFRAETWYKTGSYLRPILRNWKSGLNVFPESSEDRMLVYPEATTSTGLELYNDLHLGKRVDVRAGYALSFVNERVTRMQNVNDPLKLVFDSTHAGPQDQRHALNLDVTYRLSGKWTATTALTYHSGWPYTNETGVSVRRRNGTMDLVVRPDSVYGARLPSYQRVDLRVTRRKVTANSEFRFFVEAINLTNHENVLGYDIYRVRDAAGALRVQRDPETWFSLLPSAGFSWSRKF